MFYAYLKHPACDGSSHPRRNVGLDAFEIRSRRQIRHLQSQQVAQHTIVFQKCRVDSCSVDSRRNGNGRRVATSLLRTVQVHIHDVSGRKHFETNSNSKSQMIHTQNVEHIFSKSNKKASDSNLTLKRNRLIREY